MRESIIHEWKLIYWLNRKLRNISKLLAALSSRNAIPTLWIKLDEDLILIFPTLTGETESLDQSEMFIEKSNLMPKNELGSKIQIYYEKWTFPLSTKVLALNTVYISIANQNYRC